MVVRRGVDPEGAEDEVESAQKPLETGHVQVSDYLEPKFTRDREDRSIWEESGALPGRGGSPVRPRHLIWNMAACLATGVAVGTRRWRVRVGVLRVKGHV